jgi:hypothetical protein
MTALFFLVSNPNPIFQGLRKNLETVKEASRRVGTQTFAAAEGSRDWRGGCGDALSSFQRKQLRLEAAQERGA